MSADTIADFLAVGTRRLGAAGIPDAALEAEVLLAFTLGMDRTRLLARLHDVLPPRAGHAYSEVEERRLRREPLAYIVGRREFYGIDIVCRPGALIPRPETEMLVEVALTEIRGEELRIADVGTGSGAIAVAILVNDPRVRLTATDTSSRAIELALENARRARVVDRIDLRRGNLLEELGQFDLIVANLPYVSEAEWRRLEPEVRDYEPMEALVGGPAGTETIRRFLVAAPGHLAGGGTMALEIGAGQGEELAVAARTNFPEATIVVRTDLAGLDRVLEVRR